MMQSVACASAIVVSVCRVLGLKVYGVGVLCLASLSASVGEGKKNGPRPARYSSVGMRCGIDVSEVGTGSVEICTSVGEGRG